MVAAVEAQVADSARYGTLSGVVLAVERDLPLSRARVTLIPDPHGLLPADPSGVVPLASSRTSVTAADGSYRFPDVAPGTYRLLVRRIGYRPAVVDLDLGGTEGLRLSVGLEVAPIRLTPVTVRAAAEPFVAAPTRREDGAWNRADVERWRQDRFLESDVQTLTHNDIVEAVTFGETDLLRALRRLPGVTTRDDWRADLRVRGATSDLTRVYFDGIPLFNPVHSAGVTSAVNADALGAVFFHPGAKSAEFESPGASAVVDLASRAAGADDGWRGRAHVARSNVGFAVDRRWGNGGRGTVGTMVAVRRSWLGDGRALVPTDSAAAEIPNDFADVVARVDVDLGAGQGLEVSALWERDWIGRDLTGGPRGNKSTWGTLAGRATFHTPFLNGSWRYTLAFSRYDASVSQVEPVPARAQFYLDPPPTQPPTDHSLSYVAFRAQARLPAANGLTDWRFGYELSHRAARYDGSPLTPYSLITYAIVPEIDGDLVLASVWGEKWIRPGDRFTLRAGVRAEMGTGVPNQGDLRLAPQLTVRYDVTERVRLALGLSQSYQYEQTVGPSGLKLGPDLTVTPAWTVAGGEDRPVVVTDQTTLGVEYWLGDEWLAAATYYDRESQGLMITDPAPGTTDDDRWWVNAAGHAEGLEVSLRRLVGRWTVGFNYALGFSDLRAGDLSFPSSADRRHVVNATAGLRVFDTAALGRARVAGALTAASGAPYTRIHPGIYDCEVYPPACAPIVSTLVEGPNAERGPWLRGLDLMIDWSRSFGGIDISAYAQIQNVTDDPGAVTYRVDNARCVRITDDAPFCGADADAFLPGLRRYQRLGLRVAF